MKNTRKLASDFVKKKKIRDSDKSNYITSISIERYGTISVDNGGRFMAQLWPLLLSTFQFERRRVKPCKSLSTFDVTRSFLVFRVLWFARFAGRCAICFKGSRVSAAQMGNGCITQASSCDDRAICVETRVLASHSLIFHVVPHRKSHLFVGR